MRLTRKLLVLTLTTLLAGCSAFGWLPWVGDDEDKKKEEELEPMELERIEATVKLETEWSEKIGDGSGRKYLRLRPVIAADRIFAADGYGAVEALDRFTGDEIWETEIGEVKRSWNPLDRRDPSFVSGAVGYAHGLVLIGTTAGEVVALNATDGSEAWRVSVGAEVLAPPSGGLDLVFVNTEDGRLLALEKATGALRWSYENPVPILMLRGSSKPVFANGVVYAGFANGMVAAVRAETGEPVWDHLVMLPEGRSELERMVDVDASPAVSAGLVFAVAYQGRLKALRAQNGMPVWEQEVSSFLDLAVDSGKLVAVDSRDAVLAFNPQSSASLWKQEGLLRRELSPPTLVGDSVLIADSEGYVHVLAGDDGRFIGRRKIDGDGVRAPILVADDLIYVLGNSGKLVALKLKPR
ncbi:MAG: outer membrane protein assembly factor BamB [Pseudomonadales bacterium]